MFQDEVGALRLAVSWRIHIAAFVVQWKCLLTIGIPGDQEFVLGHVVPFLAKSGSVHRALEVGEE